MEATGFMQHIPDGMYTRAQVAAKIGRSRDTIRRWHDDGIYVATHSQKFGERHVWLYDENDIAEMKRIARSIKPGQKPRTDNEG